jgi:hypothetical protein
MKFLKSGIIPFFAGVTFIISYASISPYKIGADSSPYSISILNILLTLLFLFSCCFAAFQYGKRYNKSGLFGLIAVFALFYVLILLSLIPGFFGISPVINARMAIIFFSYPTLFLIPNSFFVFGSPAIMIIIIIFLWFIGKKAYP